MDNKLHGEREINSIRTLDKLQVKDIDGYSFLNGTLSEIQISFTTNTFKFRKFL